MKNLVVALTVPLLTGTINYAQISEGGLPASFQPQHFTDPEIFNDDYQVHALLAPDMELVNTEDLVSSEKGMPYRGGINIPVSYSITNSGTWLDLPNGDRIWRLGIEVPDAQALSLYFSERVIIPEGGKLHAYNEKRSQYVGAYTSRTPSFYAMEMIQGDLLTLEYYMPAGSTSLPVIEISEIVYYYRGVEAGIAYFRDGEAIMQDRTHGNCEVDAMCDEADGWENQRNAAVRYSFKIGTSTYFCSATVINNTAQDCTPYMLTANHCGEPNADADFNQHMWYFNYQRPNCTPGNTGKYSGAQSQTMSGGIFRASSTLGTHPGSGGQVDGCDFVLAELESGIPTSYHAFYAGWSRDISPTPQSGVCFHHPAGDEKKISTYTSPLIAATYNGGWAGAHWSVTWAATDNGHGVTEGGSSGSAILNQDGLIVGHLSGGSSFCTAPTDTDLYGKFHRAWDLDGTGSNAQLKSWLDPDGSNVETLTGTYGSCPLVSTPVYEPKVMFSVYPNPVAQVLTIELGGISDQVESVELKDITGRVVMVITQVEDIVTFDLSEQVAGVYFVQVNTPDASWSERIVKI